MKIQEIMSKPAVTCRQTETANSAAQLMWEHDCGVIPVTDGDGRLVGIVTDRDICMAAYTKGRPPRGISVSDAMSKQVFTCHPDDSLEVAERLMSDKQIRRVPIVDGENRPVGLLSLNDVVRHVASTRRKDGMEREAVETMAAVCQPRPKTSLMAALVQPEARALAQ
jgi:CBS domain-containing protein